MRSESQPAFDQFTLFRHIPSWIEKRKEFVRMALVQFRVERVMDQVLAPHPPTRNDAVSDSHAQFRECVFDDPETPDSDLDLLQYAG